MIKRLLVSCLMITALAVLPQHALASGGDYYGGSKVKKSSAPQIDSAKYSLGQKIYTGKADLGDVSQARASSQKLRLEELQSKVGEAVPDLVQLAGRLSDEELAALEYFISKRHR